MSKPKEISSEIEELRRLLAESEQQRSHAEQQRSHAEQQRYHAEQQRSYAEQQLSKTNLPTFLDGLHKHLTLGLEVGDKTQSTRGDPANSKDKIRPRKLRAWESFPRDQEKIWQSLMDSTLVEEKLFSSLHALEDLGENVRRRPVSSELDVNHFLRHTVEDHVSRIVEELYKDVRLRQTFGLKGFIRFENHSNTLSAEGELEEGMQSMNFDGRSTERRSSGIAAARESNPSAAASEPKTPQPDIKRPRADQFCVYNVSHDSSESTHRVAAYVKEYKSPHKVTLGHIYEGLGDIDVDDVVQKNAKETRKVRFQRAMLALLSQPYDYMIRSLRQVAVFSTGEADIYLRIGDDPATLLYHLSVPKGDVGADTGWNPTSNDPNRLHLTAVAQSLAFTLQALKLPSKSQAWGLRTVDSLPKWKVVPAALLEEISKDKAPSSDYRPPKAENFVRSPIQLRRRGRNPNPSRSGCRESQTPSSSDDDDPDTPSRRPRTYRGTQRRQPALTTPASTSTEVAPNSHSGDNGRRYCTLKCLFGLVHGGELDHTCPNVFDHGTTCHVINKKSFIKRLQRQLTKTVNADCETLGIHGSRGALLKVTLSSHGYTMPAKCTVPEFRNYLRHEATVYDSLLPIQGIYVPLHLGSIDLVHPYSYDGIAYLEHMMLMSPAGLPPDAAIREIGQDKLVSKVKESLSAIHDQNVMHKDPAPRNWRYNPETENVVFFDFERAELVPPRSVLGVISPNRKRKSMEHCGAGVSSPRPIFAQEINVAMSELRCYL